MAGTTPKRLLPYPSNGDVPNIANDFNLLARQWTRRSGLPG